MATYISLLNFTEKGIQEIKNTSEREKAMEAAAKKFGASVKQAYWTLGGFDGVLILEAPNDEAATAALLSLGAHGFVHTQTLRAFTGQEMQQIIGKLP
jgi:uncharacterized protein with GYD domain